MTKTKIEWLDGGYTWNPVTGCLNQCPYCYAEKFTKRFKGADKHISTLHAGTEKCKLYELRYPAKIKGRNASYPFGFSPTFHRYRLAEPQGKKKPQNIFVCSMADLFGEWVPDEWIELVYQACEQAPQHRYLFLTKNPSGIFRDSIQLMKDAWYGTTITMQRNLERNGFLPLSGKRFLSIEPLLEQIDLDERPYRSAIPFTDWVIIGAETGNRKGKVIPKREWIENIVNECRKHNVPVFMKNSLAKIWGEPLIQEYPWKGKEANNA